MSAVKVLIINVHSTLNAGDRALLECTIQQIRENFSDVEIKISANWPEEDYFASCEFSVIPSFSALTGQGRKRIAPYQILSALEGWWKTRPTPRKPDPDVLGNWSKIIDGYDWADLVVGVAGNQFHSSGRFSWPFLLMCMSVKLAHDYGKPFYTMPQSIGPFQHQWEKQLMRSLYRRGRIIFLRDQVSIELASAIGIGEKAAFAPDPAFAYPPVEPSRGLQILAEHGYDPTLSSVGVTVLPELGRAVRKENISNYYSVLASALGRLMDQRGVHLFFFNQVTGFSALEDDRFGIKQILERLDGQKEKIHWVNRSLSPAELKACYGWMDLFIPARLHSGIFALGMYVPALFIGYLTKTRGVLQSMGLGEWMVQIEELNSEKLWMKMREAWDNRQQNAALLRKILPSVIEAAKIPGARIAQDFKGH